MKQQKVLLEALRRTFVKVASVLLRVFLGMVIKLFYPVRVKNRWHMPRYGPVVVVMAPHTTAIESGVVGAAFLNLRIGFLAKSQYWDKKWSAFFMDAVGAFPLKRGDGREAEMAINTSARRAAAGGIVSVYPEGTRNRTGDGKVHKGGNGVIRIVLRASEILGQDIPIVLMALRDFDDLKFPWENGYRWRVRTIIIGEPIYLSQQRTTPEKLLKGRALEFAMSHRLMPEVMEAIAQLSGRQYDNTPLSTER